MAARNLQMRRMFCANGNEFGADPVFPGHSQMKPEQQLMAA
jgi:hypothetical protein